MILPHVWDLFQNCLANQGPRIFFELVFQNACSCEALGSYQGLGAAPRASISDETDSATATEIQSVVSGCQGVMCFELSLFTAVYGMEPWPPVRRPFASHTSNLSKVRE